MISNPSPLRFLCFGTGAIGTYVGGSLALAGQEVTFIDRPQVASIIQQTGLRLQLSGGEKVVKQPEIKGSLGEALAARTYDVAIVAIKSFDTASLLDEVKPYHGALPPFIGLQNGVENEALIAQVIGEENVIAGSVTTAIGRNGSGSITLERLRGIGIAGRHPIVPALVEGMKIAGLNARRYVNPFSMKWSKMLTNLLANASSAILDMPPAEIFAHPGLYRFELKMLKEALAVMDMQKIPVMNLPGTPVWWLVWIARWLPPSLSQPLLMNSLGKGRGAKMPSFHIDLYGGRSKSEVDYLNGAVVRFGAKYQIPTPINRWLNETLTAMSTGSLAKNQFAHNPEKFLVEAGRFQ